MGQNSLEEYGYKEAVNIDEVQKQLILVKNVIDGTYSLEGNNVYEIAEGKKTYIGTLPTADEIREKYHIDPNKESVSEVTVSGIRFVVDGNTLIGVTRDTPKGALTDGVSTIAGIESMPGANELIKLVLGEEIESKISSGVGTASLIIDMIDYANKNEGGVNYDRIVEMLSGLTGNNEFDFLAPQVINAYYKTSIKGQMNPLIDLMQIELDEGNLPSLEFVRYKGSEVYVPVTQGSSAEEGGGITADDVYRYCLSNLTDEGLYNLLKQIFVDANQNGEVSDEDCEEWINELLGQENEAYDTAGKSLMRYAADPLVIDLDGDGFELLSTKDGVYFDEDAKGLAEKTEWVSADDALLTIDLNGDGVINDGSELFGTSTVLANGNLARTGFEALAQYDENGDDVIDENDAVFSKLKVWQDKNSDGVSQADELYGLDELGIASISLNPENVDGTNSADITYQDGRTTRIGEFDFASELYNTREKSNVEVSEEIAELPDVRAMGNLASLHTLMQLDETGTLVDYVKQFMEASSAQEKEQIVKHILYYATGADRITVGSRGSFFDAQKLRVIEQVMGRDFVGTAGANPVNTAAPILNNIYNNIHEIYYNLLNGESYLKDYLAMTFWTTDEKGQRYLDTSMFRLFVQLGVDAEVDMKDVVGELGRYLSAINPQNEINYVDYVDSFMDNREYMIAVLKHSGGKTRLYEGTNENDLLQGTAGLDYFFMGAGNDIAYGYGGNDRLYGEEGNDNLYGGAGDDTLVGGTGNDYMDGGAGADTYVIGAGDGNDTIYNYDTSADRQKDRIVFGEGIRPEDIELRRWGMDLYITNAATGQVTKIQNEYCGKYYGLSRIEFADGTVWDAQEFMERTVVRGTDGDDTVNGGGGIDSIYSETETFYMGAGNDTVKAGSGNDTIYGEEGNDYLYGEGGDDTLIGGTGNDYMEGGAGADTYVIGAGDGDDIIYNYDPTVGKLKDRIVFGEGIRPEDIELRRWGMDLYITNAATGQVTKIQNEYCGKYYGLSRIEFADGTVWDAQEFMERTVVRGTDGDDTVNGGGGIDSIYSETETFYMGAGNDTVKAGSGNDTIYGEEGNDYLYGEGGDDTLIGGTGNDYMEGGAGADTYVIGAGDGDDIIYNYDPTVGKLKDRIVFGEGIRPEDIELRRWGMDLYITNAATGQVTKIQNEYCGKYYGLSRIEFADGTVWDAQEFMERTVVRGTDGDDTVNGGGGIDSIYSETETFYMGAGNDTVKAGSGNDTIYGEEGNDYLYGEGGDDTLIGGTGNDYMEGGAGADTYVIGAGDGDDIIYNYDPTVGKLKDRIVFGEGIRPEDIELRRWGMDLYITNAATGQVTKIQNEYCGKYYGLSRIEFADGTVWDAQEFMERTVVRGTDGDDTVNGGGGIDSIYSETETFYMGAGNDTVKAGSGNDTIYGEEGNDYLYGGDGDDTLIGGTGNDYMNGGNGADTYIIGAGDGNDTIYNYDTTADKLKDRIVFGEGIRPEDLELRRWGTDLYITNAATGQVTKIQNEYNGNYYGLSRIEFADGTVWDAQEFMERTVVRGTDGNDTVNSGGGIASIYSETETFYMGAGNDTVKAGSGNDTIYGEEGNDYLYGGDGDDTLIGGTGNDYMNGGNGADTYIIGAGDGNDTIYNYDTTADKLKDRIVFGEGIRPEDIELRRWGADLYITNTATGQVTKIQNEYSGNAYGLSRIEFADGTVWDAQEFMERTVVRGTDGDDTVNGGGNINSIYSESETFYMGDGNDTVKAGNGNDTVYGETGDDSLYGGAGDDTLVGGDGNDTVYGENGDDTLIGGTGNDYLDGGTGNDTYIFNMGDGQDTITDRYGNNIIIFGAGIRCEDITLFRAGNNLEIRNGMDGDSITITNAYSSNDYRISEIRFDSGITAAINYDTLELEWEPLPEEMAEEILDESLPEDPLLTDSIISSGAELLQEELGQDETVSESPQFTETTEITDALLESGDDSQDVDGTTVNMDIQLQLMAESMVEPTDNSLLGDTNSVSQITDTVEMTQLWVE